jgi:LmbE family N-acetylglucosaminyl deacetylase
VKSFPCFINGIITFKQSVIFVDQYLVMRRFSIIMLVSLIPIFSFAQTPRTYTSSEILLQLKKLNVVGSVLYIAAHPDDENTRLLAYLANEKLYRTGYLSLTRGDGGQNLIGDEQGIDLGLIRTQELLSARRIDGAEQFFTRAYDFGFSKSAEEALSTWGHDKILSDVVWVIRNFRPDVIITRFPGDSRAGHGHHAASSILASEAFDAAGDASKFPEQLTEGVAVWKPARLLWNTFNFGNTNTQNESQFKIDVGMYNALLGKGYGEIAAISRSQHKSQGFGVPAQRGTIFEYFETLKGEKPSSDLMDGIDLSWKRVTQKLIGDSIKNIISHYDVERPYASVHDLVSLYNSVDKLDESNWKQQKLKELRNVIENASGLFFEAVTSSQYAVQGDSLNISISANSRLHANGDVAVNVWNTNFKLDSIKKNVSASKTIAVFVKPDQALTQPYWLVDTMGRGSFNVSNQQHIGKPENDPLTADFKINLEGTDFIFTKPLRYKYTDPVKGEIYQPVYVVPKLTMTINPPVNLINISHPALPVFTKTYKLFTDGNNLDSTIEDYKQLSHLRRGENYSVVTKAHTNFKTGTQLSKSLLVDYPFEDIKGGHYKDIREIEYDHIPSIKYFKPVNEKVLFVDLKTSGKSVGYIAGAGDKVPQALQQMGYTVTLLKQADIKPSNLKNFDAIVTGIRAYNTNEWMGNVYETLMQYVKDGGVLVMQYNTNNFISSLKSKLGPYSFTISRNRITDETAKVNFLLPDHPALNYPNKITEKDFEGWIQERSIYHADKIDSNYQRILSMKDPGESEDEGSLIIADYGKGRFVYTGLVFFRELPVGVPGAYRLFANLLARPFKSLKKGETKTVVTGTGKRKN